MKTVSIVHNNWLVKIKANGIVRVSLNGEIREYRIEEKITGVELNGDYVYVYVKHNEKKFYQFKFEEGNFFVGDVFDKDDDFLETFADYVFGGE